MQITDLVIGYKNGREAKPLLQKLNLSIKRGQLICLLGANGVGKSTLIRSIAGLHPPISGEVLIREKSITDYSRKELAQNISLVLTDPIQGGNLSVLELVQMGRYPHTSWTGKLQEEDHRKVEEAMEKCDINYIRDANIFEISDGQLQKALIARALAQDGDLMLLDEPTVHLDANNRFTIMELLKSLVLETGKSILISTHQVEMALQMADELWLANCGESIIADQPQVLIDNNIISKMFPYLSKISKTE